MSNLKQQTSLFQSTLVQTSLASGHWFWQSCFSKTVSTTARFCIVFFHISLSSASCRLWKKSFLHLLQNTQAICCTRCHPSHFEHLSGLLNSPGGGTTIIVFIVRRLLFESGISTSTSKSSSVSAINVLIDSSFKDWLWVFNNPSKIVLADQI